MAFKAKAPSTVSDINVTPLVDVMLVLLIVFMVITPMLQKDVTVDMAKANNAIKMADADKEDAVVISITRDGKIYLKKNPISLDKVTTKVKDMIANRLGKTVYLKCDARAKYGDVVNVVDAVRAAGVEDLGLLTQQVERRPGMPETLPPPTS
ncbi:MAG TPA: biopolymer transporter ExbD [Terriglobia bacterium]|nr:biopolymer transporter ExbD [Terriglobia bacterium]